MRRLSALMLVLFALGLANIGEAQAKKKPSCTESLVAIQFYKTATWKWQLKLGLPLTKASKSRIVSCKYAQWVASKWRTRARKYHDNWVRYQIAIRDPRTAICTVFGDYCQEAISVAECESHLYVWASNGQYQGMFQMGSSERRIYGHGTTPLAQAQAAYRYFVASGRDWSPWQCRPSGTLAW